jgi:hypothetical protein
MRHIDGVTMTFDKSNLSIIITLHNDFNFYTLIEILYLLTTDPATNPNLTINDISVKIEDEPTFVEYIFENVHKAIIPKISIKYKDVRDIDYENGCIIYAVIPGYPPLYFMNLELNSW